VKQHLIQHFDLVFGLQRSDRLIAFWCLTSDKHHAVFTWEAENKIQHHLILSLSFLLHLFDHTVLRSFPCGRVEISTPSGIHRNVSWTQMAHLWRYHCLAQLETMIYSILPQIVDF
jgi:hypothetical protein